MLRHGPCFTEGQRKQLNREGNMKIVKDYFGNGYRTWDGIQCPRCGAINDPDRLTTVREQGGGASDDYRVVCPQCNSIEDEDI